MAKLSKTILNNIDDAVAAFEAEREKFISDAGILESRLMSYSELRRLIHSSKWRPKKPSHLRDKLVRRAHTARDAGEKFDILGTKCVHRVGPLEIGDMAVWAGATAAHRKQAFLACEYIIDQIKSRVPIWKKEYYMDGDSGWVNAPMSLTDRPSP